MLITDTIDHAVQFSWYAYQVFYISTRLLWLLFMIAYAVHLRVRILAPKEGKEPRASSIHEWAHLVFVPVAPEAIAFLVIVIAGLVDAITKLWALLINAIAKIVIRFTTRRNKKET